MKQQWQHLSLKFNELTTRERGLILGAIVITLLLVFSLPLKSNIAQYQQQKRESFSLQQQIEQTQLLIANYQERLTLDPNEDSRRQLEKLDKELSEIEDQFTLHNVVPANYMPALLSNILAKTENIKVISFDSIAPEPLLQVGDNQKMNLYSHGIKLTLHGNYFAILRFIKAVESMPDKLYWKSLDYQVNQYPKANVTLEFYTLNINKDFISVAK